MLKPYSLAEVRFEKGAEIGKDGKNSQTYVARDLQLGAEIVIKQISKSKLGDADAYFEEAQNLYASSHPNVVQIYYACADPDHIYLAMPYYKKGSVKGLITGKFMTVREIVSCLCQALAGLHNIHAKRLVHLDIKPDNILLSDRGEALIADFGQTKRMNLSGVVEQDRLYHSIQAPESLGRSTHTRHVDIYQMGLTAYRMCNGDDEFYRQLAKYTDARGNFDRATFHFDVRNEKFPDRKVYPEHIPTKLRNVIKKCLKADPTERYQSPIEISNALATIDGVELDWRLEESSGSRTWEKNEKGTQYVFTVAKDGSSAMYKTIGSGTPRRVSDGHMAAPTQKQIATILKTY